MTLLNGLVFYFDAYGRHNAAFKGLETLDLDTSDMFGSNLLHQCSARMTSRNFGSCCWPSRLRLRCRRCQLDTTFWTLQIASNANLGHLSPLRHRKYVVLRDIDAKAADATKLQMKPKERNVREICWAILTEGCFWVGLYMVVRLYQVEAFFRGDDKALTLYGTKSWAPNRASSQWFFPRAMLLGDTWLGGPQASPSKWTGDLCECLKYWSFRIKLYHIIVNNWLVKLIWIIPWFLDACNKKSWLTGKLLSPKGDEDDEAILATRIVWIVCCVKLGNFKNNKLDIFPEWHIENQEICIDSTPSIAQPLFCWLWKGPLDTVVASWVFFCLGQPSTRGCSCWKKSVLFGRRHLELPLEVLRIWRYLERLPKGLMDLGWIWWMTRWLQMTRLIPVFRLIFVAQQRLGWWRPHLGISARRPGSSQSVASSRAPSNASVARSNAGEDEEI